MRPEPVSAVLARNKSAAGGTESLAYGVDGIRVLTRMQIVVPFYGRPAARREMHLDAEVFSMDHGDWF